MCKYPAGLVQGVRGAPAPVVEFLPGASAALVQGVAGEVYDVEGVHDCLCVGEFFGGSALEPGESIHSDDLDTAAPRIGLGGQPGFEDLLGAARDHVQEPGGATAISDGRQVQDDGDEFVAVGGVAPHVFIHANDAHALTPGRIVDQRALAFGQDSSVSGSSRTRPGPERYAPPSHDEQPAPPAPSAPPSVRAWRADRPLDSYPDATRENTPGTGRGARSRAQSWDTTRRARARGA